MCGGNIDLDDGGGEARVRMASVVEPRWLDGTLRTADEVVFDNERWRAVGLRRTWYRDLLLDQREVPPSPAEVEGALARAAADDLEHAVPFENDDLASFLARLRSLARWMPELDLPTFEDSALRELLPILCPGRRSFAELRRAPWLDTLRGLLTAPQLAALERHAPERLPVPSGSLLRLRYEPGEPPVLEARIQEMFGLGETPRVAAGRVAVLLHLLAPNRRPQQITDDLESFWNRTYPEVRKELRARYPRHAWPEDPWNASPERRPASRRRSK